MKLASSKELWIHLSKKYRPVKAEVITFRTIQGARYFDWLQTKKTKIIVSSNDDDFILTQTNAKVRSIKNCHIKLINLCNQGFFSKQFFWRSFLLTANLELGDWRNIATEVDTDWGREVFAALWKEAKPINLGPPIQNAESLEEMITTNSRSIN